MQIKRIAERQEQRVNTIHGLIILNASLMPAEAKLPTLWPSKIVWTAKEQPQALFAHNVPPKPPNIFSIIPSAQPAQLNTAPSAQLATLLNASPALAQTS
jgi:hypothetical protein